MTACGSESGGACGAGRAFDFGACRTLAEMVDHFLEVRGDRSDLERAWWGKEGLSMEAACDRAMFMYGCVGGRDRHQRPYSAVQLRQLGKDLAAHETALRRAADFEALRVAVEQAWAFEPGRAPLLVYDVAHRLGYYLKREPEQVYLHAGPRVGANNLRAGLGDKRRRGLAEFPSSIRRLSPAQAEDFLCNARKWLHKGLWD